MSRNKQEGHYDGRVRGVHKRGLRMGKPWMLYSRNTLPLNRKQRKMERFGGYYSPSFFSEN